ncbi:hypothetical protein [Pararhodonellum marinum]|uniref:hypothetical protein n=1 Tax=Pararhodonellum marinum TaxID=2755358 RepID=UPI00188EFFBD|nr:hypothetical protein [Pararhodonellum marinum]
MKTLLFTQKNVCALIAVAMAFTIVFSAKAQENGYNRDLMVEVLANEEKEISDAPESIEVFIDLALQPTVTFINKYGEVVAEFYGEKEVLKKKFGQYFDQGSFLTASGNQEFYLIS